GDGARDVEAAVAAAAADRLDHGPGGVVPFGGDGAVEGGANLAALAAVAARAADSDRGRGRGHAGARAGEGDGEAAIAAAAAERLGDQAGREIAAGADRAARIDGDQAAFAALAAAAAETDGQGAGRRLAAGEGERHGEAAVAAAAAHGLGEQPFGVVARGHDGGVAVQLDVAALAAVAAGPAEGDADRGAVAASDLGGEAAVAAAAADRLDEQAAGAIALGDDQGRDHLGRTAHIDQRGGQGDADVAALAAGAALAADGRAGEGADRDAGSAVA